MGIFGFRATGFRAIGFRTTGFRAIGVLRRPLADALSYLAENKGPLDTAILSERLSDIAKGLILSTRHTETARIDLVCAAFKVPTSTAKPDRGISLMGSNFARTVARLRQDKKVLVGDENVASGTQQRQALRQSNRQQDRQGPRRTPWKRRSDGSAAWNAQGGGAGPSSAYPAGPRNNNGNNSQGQQGMDFHSLASARQVWCTITSDGDAWVLRAVEGYRITFLDNPERRVPPPPTAFSETEKGLVDELVDELLQKGAIRPILPGNALFVSNLFLVSKRGTDKRRPVINLKRLNEHIPDQKFKMEGWMEVKETVFEGCFFARIDLKDAYLSVRIHEDSQPYLTFQWRGQLFCWSRLPFGLKSSPRVFTKLLKPVVAALRREGISLIVYLDDFLLVAASAAAVEAHAKRTCQLLESLGYTVNVEKSQLEATQRVVFLGYCIDSVSLKLSVPTDETLHVGSSG